MEGVMVIATHKYGLMAEPRSSFISWFIWVNIMLAPTSPYRPTFWVMFRRAE